MNNLPDGTRGKILALSIGAVCLCVLYVGIVVPLLGFYVASERALEDRRAALTRYEAAARDLPRLRREAQERRERSGGGLLLSESSDAVAAAGLQSTLKDLVEAGGTTLESAQTLPAETVGNFRRVGVRLSFSGTLELLTSVLLGIETANPVLTVGSLDLHSADEGGGELAIAMDVYGFRSR